MKKIILLLITASFLASCSDFLNTAPYDAISSETFWKTEDDARKAVVGCYSDFASGYQILYMDCTSDIGLCPFVWEGGYTQVANGTLNASDASGLSLYGYSSIRRCNTFLANIDKIAFKDETEKKNLIAQVRVIRAYKYALMNQWYGGVPLSNELAETAAEAQLPRNTQKEVYDFVMKDIDAALVDLNPTEAEVGRITKGTALALKMRTALHLNDYTTALSAAQEIEKLGLYSLESKYSNLFALTGKGSKEVIHATQYLMVVSEFWLTGAMYNQVDNGWSSIVPTQNLVDMYEMANGQTIKEPGSGYDAVHPYAGRDPRFYASILYAGKDWVGPVFKGIFNTLDTNIGEEANPNNPNSDGSKTSLTWGKYLFPGDQYKDSWKTDACPILYRYAEVLLTIAECNVEMPSGDLGIAADYIDQIRSRAGMPAVDRAKYGSKEAMRQLVRRERTIELAGEGLRRQDILRWDDGKGQMVAETVMSGPLTRVVGTVDYAEKDETKRAKITVGETVTIENRVFEPYMKFLPFPQAELDRNKQLKQNTGY